MARILIVEDEEKIARFVTLELEHEGYQVEHAADGRTAVDLALERDYDLILLDVLLPQLNGMEVLRRVRKHSIARGDHGHRARCCDGQGGRARCRR